MDKKNNVTGFEKQIWDVVCVRGHIPVAEYRLGTTYQYCSVRYESVGR